MSWAALRGFVLINALVERGIVAFLHLRLAASPLRAMLARIGQGPSPHDPNLFCNFLFHFRKYVPLYGLVILCA